MPAFGSPHVHVRVTGSTNDQARELASAGAPGGTVITASEQTSGRGRQGRAWSAPAGKALLLSAILRPLERRHRLLPLAIPLAVCEAAEALAPVDCRVKWPNDVWLDERKLAGVLIEARFPDWAVIGVGLNLTIEPDEFPPELSWPATSLGHGATVEAALPRLCAALDRWCEADEADVLDAFRARDALSGRRVAWQREGDEGEGVAGGIADDGNLLVRTQSGEIESLGAGEVHLRPPGGG